MTWKNIEKRNYDFINKVGYFSKNSLIPNSNYFKDQLDPVIELDVNGSRKWFHFTAFEKKFFLDCPKEELPELIEAAKSLDIRSLYVYGCQTIASIIRIVASSRKPQRFARTLLALGVERSQIEQVAQNI